MMYPPMYPPYGGWGGGGGGFGGPYGFRSLAPEAELAEAPAAVAP